MCKQHHSCCEFWVDQYPQECTCGATAPRAPWFDKVEKEHAEQLAKDSLDGMAPRPAERSH